MKNPVAIRLLNQQLIVPQFKTPTEVVSHMGAMQAQEYRMMRWAVEMRTQKPSHKAFKEAYNSGQIIRLHLMRGTWQLVSAEDYWPFITLCAPKVEHSCIIYDADDHEDFIVSDELQIEYYE